MHRLAMIAALASLGLAGCDRFGSGGDEAAARNGAAEEKAGNASRAETATRPDISDAPAFAHAGEGHDVGGVAQGVARPVGVGPARVGYRGHDVRRCRRHRRLGRLGHHQARHSAAGAGANQESKSQSSQQIAHVVLPRASGIRYQASGVKTSAARWNSASGEQRLQGRAPI